MKNSVKKIGSLALGAVMAFSVVGSNGYVFASAAAKGLDPEKDAVVFATDALDGNFSPFFATSGTDTTIAAHTQIGMLTTDEKGNAVWGENEATVALDYKETMYTGSWNSETRTIDNKAVTTDGAKADYTEYEFIIKNGIKFSDGVDLTIKDVLFNLYVYLDPAYMGSATIYSTDIVGLQKYRTQNPNVSEDDNGNDTQAFYVEAEKRVQAMLDHLDPDNKEPASADVAADLEKTKELLKKDLTSDWNAMAGSLDSYEEEYTFTEDWQVYYFNYGIVSVKTKQNENGATEAEKDENGKYITTLDDADSPYAGEIEAQRNDAEKVAAYMAEFNCTEELAKEYIVRDFAIETVYETYSDDSYLPMVLSYMATGSAVRDEFAAEAKSEFFEDLKNTDGSLRVENIEGINTYTTDKDFSGKSLGEDHDVLKIVINKVDPKAKWNFAFSVAPMHYYSSKEATEKAMKNTNNTYFGVEFASKDFFDDVLKDDEKSRLPVGAGTYMAADEKGNKTSDGTKFYSNNWVYFTRNDYFETVGEGLHNAKVKRMSYRVVASSQIINALATGEIDFGQPNATQANINEIKSYKQLGYVQYRTNGYGYVGVNPKFVPDIEVRQAIMKAMNTASIVKNYYTSTLADVIYRPMSTTSWAYPEDIEEYEKIAFTTEAEEIKELVRSAGWTMGNDGIFEKDNKKLKLTFTIAGDTKDHPAYTMFEEAASFLNEECGFDITVTTSINALKSLATGALEVWAAAWSSTIDPDMYQVYHKDSTATSVKNWGYPTIFADTTGQFDYEKEIIDRLSQKIEEGRETINQDDRKEIYAEALDLVMELCVELPTYQRNDLVVYNKNVIDVKTLNQNASPTSSVIDRIWELNYVGQGGSDSNTGLIVGIIIGVVVVLGAAGVVVFLKLRKKPTTYILDEEATEETEEVATENEAENAENADVAVENEAEKTAEETETKTDNE